MKFYERGCEFYGGAVLADNTCGSVSLRDASGSDFKINVGDDPELTMSGLYEPDGAFSGYGN